MGLGIGIIFSTLVLYSYGFISSNNISKEKIESLARELGMEYKDKIKAYDMFENDK